MKRENLDEWTLLHPRKRINFASAKPIPTGRPNGNAKQRRKVRRAEAEALKPKTKEAKA
jgi:hypothetical protein